MRVAPGASHAPQSGPAPQPQGGPPQGQPKGPSPSEAIQMIEQGFTAMGQLLQSAGQGLPPEDIQLFQAAVKATDAFVQSITGGGDEQKEQAPQGKPAPSGPMPANASANSEPSPQG